MRKLTKLRFADARRGICAAIDTGAGISVLPTRVYRIVFPHVTIQPTNIKLSAYNNTPINCCGEKLRCHVNITMLGKPLKFIVTDEHTKTIVLLCYLVVLCIFIV